MIRTVRKDLTTKGLSKNYAAPKLSPTLLASIQEIKDDMNGAQKLPEAHNYQELMDSLDD